MVLSQFFQVSSILIQPLSLHFIQTHSRQNYSPSGILNSFFTGASLSGRHRVTFFRAASTYGGRRLVEQQASLRRSVQILDRDIGENKTKAQRHQEELGGLIPYAQRLQHELQEVTRRITEVQGGLRECQKVLARDEATVYDAREELNVTDECVLKTDQPYSSRSVGLIREDLNLGSPKFILELEVRDLAKVLYILKNMGYAQNPACPDQAIRVRKGEVDAMRRYLIALLLFAGSSESGFVDNARDFYHPSQPAALSALKIASVPAAFATNHPRKNEVADTAMDLGHNQYSAATSAPPALRGSTVPATSATNAQNSSIATLKIEQIQVTLDLHAQGIIPLADDSFAPSAAGDCYTLPLRN